MWFRFPEGIDQISVEQQQFHPEHKDKDGNLYFRAPDHFAPTILNLQGFSRVEQPEGAPDDLPHEDPQAKTALDNMASEVSALQDEVVRLRAENNDLIKERDALQAANDSLQKELDAADKKVEDLEAQLAAAASEKTSESIGDSKDKNKK